MMNRFLHLTLLVLLCTAWAEEICATGTVNGGGGVGIRCTPAAMSPKAFELLDLHEARLHGLNTNSNPQSDEAIELVAQLIATYSWNPNTVPVDQYTRALANNIVRPIFNGQSFPDFEFGKTIRVQFVPKLALATDAGPYESAPGCRLDQVAFFFDDSDTLQISRTDWDQLDWLNKAALAAHEIFYLGNRRSGIEHFGLPKSEMTSLSTRRFVGRLFSADGIEPKFGAFPPTAFAKCGETPADAQHGTYFFAYDSGENQITIFFSEIDGLGSAYQMKAAIDGFTIASLTNVSTVGSSADAAIEFSNVSKDATQNFSISLKKAQNGFVEFQAFSDRTGSKSPMNRVQKLRCTLEN